MLPRAAIVPKSGGRKRELVRHLVDETSPAEGPRIVQTDHMDDDGQALELGRFIVRVTVDERGSRYVFVDRRCHGEIHVRQGENLSTTPRFTPLLP